ncbi:MAG: asparagine synthase C-terminal domain-containing protein, partial [Acidimicrobiales bacterium]
GVDSGMVTAAMCKASETPVPTFTIGFGDGFKWDEQDDAAETARLLGTEHTGFTLDSGDFVDFFAKSTWHLEEPVLSQSTFAYYQLTKFAREHVKVVLTGQGADEPWAGYARYLGEHYGKNLRRLIDNPLSHRLVAALPDSSIHTERVRRATTSLGERDDLARFVNIHSVFGQAETASLMHPDLVEPFIDSDPATPMRYWQKDVAHLDGLSQLLYIDTRMSLPDDLLLYGDKLAMANSLETRVPLLDVELIEFVETLPPKLKLRGTQGKYVHKQAAERWLPSEVIKRPKRGFATPVDKWFQGELDSFLNDTMLAADSACSELFDRAELDRLLSEHRTGERNHRRQLSTLLGFEMWSRQFLRSGDLSAATT